MKFDYIKIFEEQILAMRVEHPEVLEEDVRVWFMTPVVFSHKYGDIESITDRLNDMVAVILRPKQVPRFVDELTIAGWEPDNITTIMYRTI